MKNKILFVLFAICVFPGFAQSQRSSGLINGNFNNQSKRERREIAVSVLKQIRELNNYIPSLKQSEIDWYFKESESIKLIKDEKGRMERLIKLHETPEHNTLTIKQVLDNIIFSLNKVINNDLMLKEEMYFLAWASLQLTDNETVEQSMYSLIKSGKVPNDINKYVQLGGIGEGGSNVMVWYGRGIYQYIIIPYLGGKIKT